MYYIIYDDYYNGDQIMEEILSINDAQLRVAQLETDRCVSNIELIETRHLLQKMLKRITELEDVVCKQRMQLQELEDNNVDN